MDPFEELLKSLEANGLTKGTIKVGQVEYLFSEGQITKREPPPPAKVADQALLDFRYVEDGTILIDRAPVVQPPKRDAQPQDQAKDSTKSDKVGYSFLSDYFKRDKKTKATKKAALWAIPIVLLGASAIWLLPLFKPTPEGKSWDIAQQTGTIESFRDYLKAYPQGKYAQQADKAIEKLDQAKADGETAQKTDGDTSGQKTDSTSSGVQAIDQQYQSSLTRARELMAKNEWDAALLQIDAAEKAKKSPELTELRKQIEGKKEAAKAGLLKADQEERRRKEEFARKENEAMDFISQAEQSLNTGDFTKTFELIAKAKEINNSVQAQDLERRAKAIQAAIETRKNIQIGVYLKNARDLLAKDELDGALAQVQLAEKIKNTPECADLRKQIGNRRESLRASQSKSEQDRKDQSAKNEKDYKNFLVLAEQCLQKGDFTKAQDYIARAKQIHNSREVSELEIRANAILSEIEKQKRGARTYDQSKTTPQQNVAPVPSGGEPVASIAKITDLSPEISGEFSSVVQRLVISDIPGDFQVSGFITATIKISQAGIATPQQINDQGMSVSPEELRGRVKAGLAKVISKLKFPSPINKKGEPIQVENWRINFKVGQYSGKIILVKQ